MVQDLTGFPLKWILADEMDEECSGLDIGGYLLPVDCHRDIHKEVPFVENLM
jgi:hypothetical protein